MMDDSEDLQDEKLRTMAGDFNRPPAVPKEAMWARIEAARKAARPDPKIVPFRSRPAWQSPVVRFAVGIAAVLLIGIGIGRLTVAPNGTTPAAGPSTVASQPPARERENVATQLVASEHFSNVESFLTEFNSRPNDSTFSGEAKALLVTTRLLLDSKRVTDARTRKLLDDLELILVQIATLDAKHRPQDLDFITEDLTQNHLRTRLRNAVPLGPAIRM